MSNAQRKGHGVSVRHGISSGSYKYIIKKLEQQLQESQQLYTGLADLNASLRAKEAVLLENVSSQSNNLHYVGLALFQEPLLSAQGDNTGSIAQTLLQDVKVSSRPWHRACLHHVSTVVMLLLINILVLNSLLHRAAIRCQACAMAAKAASYTHCGYVVSSVCNCLSIMCMIRSKPTGSLIHANNAEDLWQDVSR